MTRYRKLSAHYVLTNGGLLREGILSFDEKGMLAAISAGGRLDFQAAVEFYSGLLSPGSANNIIEKIGSEGSGFCNGPDEPPGTPEGIGLDRLPGIVGGFEVGEYQGAVLITGIDWDNRRLLPRFSCKQILLPGL